MSRYAQIWLVAGLLASASGCADPTPAAPSDAQVVDTPLDVGLADVATETTADIAGEGLEADAEDVGPELPVIPQAAPQLLLTVNELPTHLNGTGLLPSGKPYSIWVNRTNFTLDLMSSAPGDIDWSTLDLTCDQALTAPDGALVVPGAALASYVQSHPSSDLRRIHFTIDFTFDVAPPGETLVTCTANVSNTLGSASSDVSFTAANMPPERDPFVQPDVWLVTLSRDIFATTFAPEPGGTYTVASTHVPQGNGIVDFDEAFVGLGFFSETNLTARALIKKRLLDQLRAEAYRIFQLDAQGKPTAESVPLTLYFEGDPGAPDPATWSETGPLSMIALGGDGKPNDQENGIVGRADVDWNNQGVEDNTVYDRGVYPTGIARSILTQAIGVLAIADFLPATGSPMGDHPDDDELLDPDLDPSTLGGDKLHRYELMNFAVDMVGVAMATTLCHEIGHSLGLVPPGPPPTGLFAGMPNLEFIDNYIDGAHVDTAGLNIMQTGAVTNYVEAISQVAVFNPLNMAYLRRRIVVFAD